VFVGLWVVTKRVDALSHAQIAARSGISANTWLKHRLAGAPRPKGQSEAAIARWLREYQSWRLANGKVSSEERAAARSQDSDAENDHWTTERKKWLAQLAKIEFAERMRQLVRREDVIEFASKAALTVTHRLNSLVTKMAPLLIACRTVDEAEEMLQAEVDDVLATFRRGLEPPMEGPRHDEPAA
jgi:hypothetical protein